MPIYQTNNVSETIKVAVWRITETEDELLNKLMNLGFESASIYQTKNKNRLKQWVATRLLLNEFFKNVKIIYDDLGKPSLDNGWKISISHSNDFAAIILNKNKACGIDIEKVTSKIGKINSHGDIFFEVADLAIIQRKFKLMNTNRCQFEIYLKSKKKQKIY